MNNDLYIECSSKIYPEIEMYLFGLSFNTKPNIGYIFLTEYDINTTHRYSFFKPNNSKEYLIVLDGEF